MSRNFINIRYLAEVLCRMFPFFPPSGGILKLLINLIRSGACPPPRVKHFYRESLFLLIAFAGSCSRLFSVLQLYQLEDYLLFSPLPWCLLPHILREDELDTYPQGG